MDNKYFDNLESLEDFVNLIRKTRDGYLISGVGEYESFKSRFDSFKGCIERDLPELTIDEILKFHKFNYKLRDLYGWFGVEYLFDALQFEQYKKKKEKERTNNE